MQVPLADHGGLVAEVGHHVGEHDFIGSDGIGEGAHAVDVGILAGEQGGAAGRADGVRAKYVIETNAFAGQTIDGRGGIEGSETAAVGTDGLARVVVGHNPQYVGSVGGGEGTQADTKN